MWQIVEASLREIRLGKAEKRGSQRGGREEMRRMGKEKTKREEDGRSKKSGREMGNLG